MIHTPVLQTQRYVFQSASDTFISPLQVPDALPPIPNLPFSLVK